MANKGTTKLNLNAKTIVEHKFGNAPRGYDALEVDKFLDLVIQDYLLLEERVLVDVQELEHAKKTIEELRQANEELLLENQRLLSKIPDMKNTEVNEDNINLLKRIDAYEKFLYKMGIDPKKIK